jgi:hypothetical protein
LRIFVTKPIVMSTKLAPRTMKGTVTVQAGKMWSLKKACFKKCRRSWGMPERQSLVTFLLKAHADQMAHFAKADPAHVAA